MNIQRLMVIILVGCLFWLPKRVYAYDLAWPGVLPDSKLYKIKVLRNKIIERLIVHKAKKVEFDLLMADKTIYASKLMAERGNVALAKDAALKGENYFSILVQDYNAAISRREQIPLWLDNKIEEAAKKHQELFVQIASMVPQAEQEVFGVTLNFSKINIDFIRGMRSQASSL